MDELLELNKHEYAKIRSNLMEIISCAERLELALENADVYGEMGTVGRIVSSCYNVLSSIINSEEMAKLDEYKSTIFCLSDLAEDIVSVCRSKLRKSNIEIETDIERFVYVDADPDRLLSCLMNLIVNAAKNVDQDEGIIGIKVSKLSGSAAIIVSDNGYGAELSEIEKYLNDEDGKTGLSVVGKFCREANTNIIVDQSVEGGLIFSFRLPLAQGSDVSFKSRRSFISDSLFSPINAYLAKLSDNSE